MSEQKHSALDIRQVIDLVRSAKDLIENREMAGHVKEKGRSDYVTQVDVAVQDYLKKELYSLAPDIQFLGEETGLQEISGDRCWILDPVDGTTNLIHDYKRSSISLALMENGRTILGIVYQPYTEEMFYAEKGKGAFLNGRQIHVSRAQTMDECMFAFGTAPYEKEKYGEACFQKIYRVFMDSQDIRRSGSAAIDMAETAAGRIDGFFEPKLSIWDYAAGRLLVSEAGGRATDYEGKELGNAMKSSVVCGNPVIHELLVRKYLK